MMFGIHDWLLGLPLLGQCAVLLTASAVVSTGHALLLARMFTIPSSGTVFLAGIWTTALWSIWAVTASAITLPTVVLVSLVLLAATMSATLRSIQPVGDDYSA